MFFLNLNFLYLNLDQDADSLRDGISKKLMSSRLLRDPFMLSCNMD
jgi:hypothetical protein